MRFQGVKSVSSKGDVPVNFRPLPAGWKGGEAAAGLLVVIRTARGRRRSRSAVVEAWRVASGECLLSGGPCSPQRILAEMVDRRGWSDALGNVTTPVMALDEHPSRIVAGRRQPRMPDVGDEQCNIARFGNQGYCAAAVPLQIAIGQLIERWRLS